jgi:ribosomal protein S18 acetylase RimI-like enzyme
MEEDKIKIEQLKKSDKPEVLELFTQAFRDYPLLPVLSVKPEKTRKVIKAFLSFFGGVKSSWLYGIRKGNKLVCASLSVDSTTKLSILALIRFIFSLTCILGWHSAKELETVHKEEPKYKERYLELVLLGTLPVYHKQGYGRRMLHFLYDKAKNEGYKGLILVATCKTPAFYFYLKEGFVMEKEFTIQGTTLCWMRLVF